MTGHRSERGSAMLMTMSLSAVLLLLLAGLFLYAGQERGRAIEKSREPARLGCAQAGLELAKSYFVANSNQIQTYLKNPAVYNPVKGQWMSNSAYASKCTGGCSPADPKDPALQTNHPELFFKLDSDDKKDVYIYVRDNQDEFPPAKNDWTYDNDRNVIVGAVCISETLVPRRPDGTIDTSQMTVESLLSYTPPKVDYTSQAGGGSAGTGNIN